MPTSRHVPATSSRDTGRSRRRCTRRARAGRRNVRDWARSATPARGPRQREGEPPNQAAHATALALEQTVHHGREAGYDKSAVTLAASTALPPNPIERCEHELRRQKMLGAASCPGAGK
jgi:hypothetical protein